MSWELSVFSAKGTATYTIAAGQRLVVGRGEDADIPIDDVAISRRHAVIHGGPPLVVEDLGTSNGTFIVRSRPAIERRDDPFEVVDRRARQQIADLVSRFVRASNVRACSYEHPDTIPDTSYACRSMGDEPPKAPQERPDEQGPPPADPAEPSIGERLRASPITFVLAAINVAVFLWAETSGDTLKPGTLLRFGAVERLHVASGEVWRLGTSMFLHVGWIHLLWNTYASVGWCTVVEKVLGKPRFLAVYLLSGIGGACASAFFHRATSAGASGAMFGIIGATLVLRYRVLGDVRAFVQDKFVRSNVVNMAIWTAIGLTAVNMDNFAHGGGLVVGALTTAAATAAPPRRRVGWAAVALAVAAFVALAMRPGWKPTGDDGEAAAAYVLAYSEGIEGFTKNTSRAERIRALACRDPASAACALTKPAPPDLTP